MVKNYLRNSWLFFEDIPQYLVVTCKSVSTNFNYLTINAASYFQISSIRIHQKRVNLNNGKGNNHSRKLSVLSQFRLGLMPI